VLPVAAAVELLTIAIRYVAQRMHGLREQALRSMVVNSAVQGFMQAGFGSTSRAAVDDLFDQMASRYQIEYLAIVNTSNHIQIGVNKPHFGEIFNPQVLHYSVTANYSASVVCSCSVDIDYTQRSITVASTTSGTTQRSCLACRWVYILTGKETVLCLLLLLLYVTEHCNSC
jgi:hypothetical protein